jgi:hypothetical protein
MQYNQPYGVSDTNAPYVNGDPSLGRQGSIPPAESIEYPQREIVAVITDVGLAAPSNSDLAQLSKAVRFMRPQYALDVGTPNHIVVTLDDPPTAWVKPLTFFVQLAAGNGNTQAAVDVTITGLTGAKPLVKRSGQPLAIGDLVPACCYLLTYDGVSMRSVAVLPSDMPAPGTPGGPIDVVTGNRDYYVNPATGNDSNDGKTPATAWQTLGHAYNWIQRSIDFAGYTVTVHCADGTYTTGVTAVGICRGQAGPGSFVFIGNTSNPSNCLVSSAGVCFYCGSGAKLNIQGFKVTVSGNYSASVACSGAGSEMTLGVMDYGPSGPQGAGNANNQISCGGGASINMVSSYTISGGAAAHIVASANGSISCVGLTISIGGTPNFTVSFANAQENGTLYLNDILNHQNIYVGAATGQRYSVMANGVIFTYGAGPNYIPGTIGGSTSTGGQYV